LVNSVLVISILVIGVVVKVIFVPLLRDRIFSFYNPFTLKTQEILILRSNSSRQIR